MVQGERGDVLSSWRIVVVGNLMLWIVLAATRPKDPCPNKSVNFYGLLKGFFVFRFNKKC